jgi:hypothetical protein
MVVEMTREQWKERLPIIQAYVDGRDVQYKNSFTGYQWETALKNGSLEFGLDSEYRIKPEPKLRPWRMDEVPVGALVRFRGSMASRVLITGVYNGQIYDSSVTTGFQKYGPEDALRLLEHSTDGGKTWEPCGVQEEA